MTPAIRDRFETCPVLFREETERNEHGATKVRRLRLVQKQDFKYPIVRVEDELLREPAGDRLTKQMAMVGDHVVVKLRDPKMDEAALLHQIQDTGAVVRQKMPGSGLWLIAFAEPALDTVPRAISRLGALTQWVQYAEPDYLVEAAATPNDASFATQWAMNNVGQSSGLPHADIQALDAWNLATGSRSIVVAILDSGMDLTHPDLVANLWTNSGESPGIARVDDDHNGYVDDLHGWNFVQNNNNPADDYGHGTHCAGIIGAEGNNAAGVSGVCWRVSLLPLKFLNSSGNGVSSDAVSAISYATRMGASLTSNSYAIIGEGYSQAMKDAIDEANAAGVLFVAATGNLHTNLDLTPSYPASYGGANVITVAATDRLDEMASYSNYGANTASLAAPGSEIYSTLPGGAYGLLSGTSMACPHVAGACALLKAFKPSLAPAEIKGLILSSVDVIPALAGRTQTGGRLNLFNALLASNDILVSRGTDLIASGPVGGPLSPVSSTYTLTNRQSIAAAWTASVNRSWLTATPSSGTLNPGASVIVTLALNSESSGMLAGDHTGTLVFTSTATGRTHPRNVTVTVNPPSLYRYNLDVDPGWPRTGAWAFGVPTGQGGTVGGQPDPVAGATGAKVFGINLNGNYSRTVAPAEYLTAGPFDLSGHHGSQLRFQRWLNSDYQPWVYATIEVSPNGVLWYPVWDNGTTTITDYEWTQVTYNLTAVADGQPHVYVRWRHEVASEYPVALSGWNIDDIEILALPDRQLRLTLPPSVAEGGAAAFAKVTIVPALETDVEIHLTSDRPGSEVSFPATLTIPAGSEEATFPVTAIDDDVADGTQTVTITASATGFPSHFAGIQVHDNESASLTLSLPNTVTEGDGLVTGLADIHLPSPAAANIVVSLTSSDATELLLPATVTIPAGQTAASIPLAVQDDELIDGPQTVTITATVANWPAATASLQVLDNEPRNLAVALPTAALENSGTVTAGGTVSTSAPVETSLTVKLSTDNPAELTVPAQVVIPAGSASASFDLTFQNDALPDGPQIVHVTATAATFVSATGVMMVNDDETAAMPINPSPSEGFLTAHPDSDLAWQSDPVSGGIPESYDVFFSAADSPGAPLFLGNTTSQEWALPHLIPGAVYSWKVVARKGLTATSGPVWSFTVPPPGAVKRFGWDPIPASTPVNVPVAVRLTAYDEFDNPLSGFTGRASLSASVQVPETTTGTGATSNNILLGSYYHNARTQSIYRPPEVGPAGNLTAMALNLTMLPGQTLNNFTIRLKHTSKASYSGGSNWETSSWTTVYQSNQTFSSAGWAWFNFSTPFSYDGANNLMVDISFSNLSFSSDGKCTASNVSTYRSLSYRTDTTDYGSPLSWSGLTPSGSNSMTVPNIRFRREDVRLALSPAITGNFAAGSWSGSVTITESGAGARIKADLASDPAVSGTSDPIDIVLINAFALKAEPAFTGGLANKISWNPLGGGFDYEIQCSTAPDFAVNVSSGYITASDYTFTGLVDATSYYYRGRARGNSVVGSWSPVVHSTQDASPPSLSFSPANGAVTTAASLTLQGSATDATSGIATLTIDGEIPATGDSFASWSCSLANLPNGVKSITVTASDNAVPPNTRTVNWTITRITNPNDDTDRNGVSALMEYAFNISGPNARELLPVISTEAGDGEASSDRYLTVTYRRRLNPAGLNYLLETSSNLTTWQPVGDNAIIVSANPTGDDVTESVRVRVLPSLQNGPGFVRLRVGMP